MKKSTLATIVALALLCVPHLAFAGDKRKTLPGSVCVGKNLVDRWYIDYSGGMAKNTGSNNIQLVCPLAGNDWTFLKEVIVYVWAESSATSNEFKCRVARRNDAAAFLSYWVYAGGGNDTMHFYPYVFEYRYHGQAYYLECQVPPQAKIRKIYWVED